MVVCILIVLLFPFSARAQLVISEIMYDPPTPGADDGREWIEIQNGGTASVDVSAWKLFEGDANHRFLISQGNLFVQPGGFAVIADNSAKFLAEHAGFSGTLFDSTFSLNNTTGEKFALKDAQGIVVSEVTYTPSWGAKGDGNSLQYFSDGWSAAPPTPGTANVKSPPKPTPPPSVISQPKTVIQPSISAPKTSAPRAPATKKESSVPVREVASSSVSIGDTNPPARQSTLVWWFLLGGVVIVASLAYWIGGRGDPDEFTIIEDKDSI